MGSYDYLERMKDEEALLFKRCIRKLLDTTFIIEDKDEKLYQYISIESNHYDISGYLQLIGYDVIVEDKLKIAMLTQYEGDIETVGLRKSNLIRFDRKHIQMLVVLWLLYLERVGFSEGVFVSFGDIIDKLKVYAMEITPSEFKSAFKIFKRFSLIGFSDNDTSEDSKVQLYPSLTFCMDTGQLKQVMADYLPEGRFDLKEEETEENNLEEEE